MVADDFLSLDQAAKLLRRSKREVRELVRSGKIPAVRRDTRWLVLRSDLARAIPAGAITVPAETRTTGTASTAASSYLAGPRDEILAFISLLRDRDDQLALLQDERARLAGQVGYLQAQLADRDTRLAMLEAAIAEPIRELPAHAHFVGLPVTVTDTAGRENHSSNVEPDISAGGTTFAPPAVEAPAASATIRADGARDTVPAGDPAPQTAGVRLEPPSGPGMDETANDHQDSNARFVDPGQLSARPAEREVPATVRGRSRGLVRSVRNAVRRRLEL